MKRTILVVLIVALVSSPCFAQGTSTLSTELQEALDKAIEELGIIGASAAVITPENGLWVGVSGLSHRNPPASLKPEMLFNIGVITKTFTATLVLQLAEEGLLELDDTVGDWLSDLPEKSTRWIDDTITIRQLLQHTSGIDGFVEERLAPEIVAILLAPNKIWKPENTLRFLRRPYADPGEECHESHMDYILLGMIIERAINSNVAVEFRNRFFDPLGLENTFMNIEEPLDGEIAHGNILGIDFSRVPRGAIDSMGWTAGAIFTTAEDLAMWTEALFKGNLVSENSLGQMLDFSETWTIYKGIEIKMGLGMIAIEYLPFGKIWNMAGQWPFYSTLMGYLPDHDIIVVVLLNEYIGNPLDVMEILLEPVVN